MKKIKVFEVSAGVAISLIGGYMFFSGGTILYLVLGVVLTIMLVFSEEIKSYLETNDN